jgi:type II secretory ATPase GspE/PulE/Tfp pilus assembly ATPase PilB-like protein
LCILGEEYEPCFETAGIRREYIEFSFNEEFKTNLYSIMEQMKEILNEGGAPVISRYSVEIGDSLWNLIYDNTDMTQYSICGFYEEETQTFAVLQNRTDNKIYRVNFSLVDGNYVFEKEASDITETYENDNQFSLTDVETFEAEYAKKKEKKEDEEEPAEGSDEKEPKDEGDEKKPEDEPAEDDDEETEILKFIFVRGKRDRKSDISKELLHE